MREQQHVADGSLVGEQHDHAVDTDADAARGRHTVLEGAHVILVVLHGLVVAAGLLGHLGSEALGLIDRVVELGERVRVLVAGDDQLKAMGQARVILKALGKRANLDGVIAHEGGVDDGVLAQLVIDLGDDLAGGPLGLDLQALLACGGSKLLDRRVDGDRLAEHVGDDVGHGTACPLTGQIDGLTLVLNNLGVADSLVSGLDDTLGECLHALEVGEGTVGLHRSELGVVGKVHALVTEDAADLEHALKAADDAALEVQLGGDTQVALLIERVEVGNERLGRGTTLDGLQDGGLDLHVAVGLHKATEGGENLRTLTEGLANVVVGDQVDIALTIAGLLVGKTVELLGQRTNGLGKQGRALRGNGKLAALGAHDHAGHAQDIAQVEGLERIPGSLVHVVDAAEQLNLGSRIAHDDEHDLALTALGDHAAGDLHDVLGVLAIGKLGVLSLDIGDVVLKLRVLGIGVLARLEQGGALGQAGGALVVERRCLIGGVLVLCHKLAPQTKTLPRIRSQGAKTYLYAGPWSSVRSWRWCRRESCRKA